MKKIKHNTSRHVSSMIIVIIFALFGIASDPLPWWNPDNNYLEGPCEQVPPTSPVYKCTVTVRDKATGVRIPNADVSLRLNSQTYRYLGQSNCVLVPAQLQSFAFSGQTNGSGVVYHEFNPVFIRTNLDKTFFYCSVSAANYTSAEISKEVYPDATNVKIDIQLIDLTTQP